MLGGAIRRAGGVLTEPHIRSGLALGIAAAAESYQPSLMDRPRTDQALVVAASATTAYCAGSFIGRVGRGLLVPAGRTSARLPSRGSRMAADAAVASTLALALVALLRSSLARYDADGRRRPTGPDVAWSLGVGTGIAAAAGGSVVASRTTASILAQRLSTSFGGSRKLWAPLTSAAIAGAASMAGRAAAHSVLSGIAASNRRTESRYADPPATSSVSGSPDSAVRFEDLGLQGRRYVSDAPTAHQIDELLGEVGAKNPVRVYVGVASAGTVEGRVALAIRELRRTAAFDRSLLIIGSPAGTGYFNPIPIEAAEYLARGDIASVAIQYGSLPSMLSTSKAPIAIEQHAALLRAVAGELATREAANRPRVVLYGESLGAQTSQGAFVGRGTRGLEELGVDRALWVGTPHASSWRREVFADGADVDREQFGCFSSIDDYAALPAGERGQLRYFFLDHHEDPVTLFSPEIAYRRPRWLGPPESRPPNVSRTQRWVPLVTFWQTAIDTKNAATVVPGEFKAFGHDYRADLAAFVRVAYGLDRVTAEQMRRIEARLRASEIERAARIADG
jgi:uncharacterized membrane protein